MDKLQRWLAKKERESPSPSLRDNPTTLGDKLKILGRTLGRRVEYIQPKVHNSLTDAEREQQERKRNFYELHKARVRDISGCLLRARKELVEAIKNPILYNHAWKKDNLDEALKALEGFWYNIGVEWKLPRDKLIELRKKAVQPEIAAVTERLYDVTTKPCMSLQDIEEPFQRLVVLHRAAELPFDRNKVWKDVLRHYTEKAPSIPLAEALNNNPGHYIVHGIPASGEKRSLGNNHVLDPRNLSWKDFLAIVLDHAPTLSCSSVTDNSPLTEFYSRVGVIIKEGRVYNAFPSDEATQAITPGIRLPLSDGLAKTREIDISKRVNRSLMERDRRSPHNEIVVGSPKITGLFYHNGYHSLGSGFSTQIPFLRTEEKTGEAIDEIREIAKQRGLPLYRFAQGEGFVLDSVKKLAVV